MADDDEFGIPKAADFQGFKRKGGGGDGEVVSVPHPKDGSFIPALSANWTYVVTQTPEGGEPAVRLVLIAEGFAGLPVTLCCRLDKVTGKGLAQTIINACDDLPGPRPDPTPERG